MRQLIIPLRLYQDPVSLQVAAYQNQRFADKRIDVERSSAAGVALEDRANAFDHSSRAAPIGADFLERRLRFIEIGQRAIQPAQARSGIRYHRRQWLLDLVSNGGRHRV